MGPGLTSLPSGWEDARVDLHRVVVHVLARRRHALAGKIGLRATPGGIGTPAAGPDHEVVRLAGAWLVRERTGEGARTDRLDLRAATLADAAALVEVDLAAPLDVGADTPPPGDPASTLAITDDAGAALGGWFGYVWGVLDELLGSLGPQSEPSVVQIWPEHFDAACDVAVVGPGGSDRANVGGSPGDAFEGEPYLYLGPWSADRPGEPGYWNAPFGAVLRHRDLLAAEDPVGAGVAFLREGLSRLGSAVR